MKFFRYLEDEVIVFEHYNIRNDKSKDINVQIYKNTTSQHTNQPTSQPASQVTSMKMESPLEVLSRAASIVQKEDSPKIVTGSYS